MDVQDRIVQLERRVRHQKLLLLATMLVLGAVAGFRTEFGRPVAAYGQDKKGDGDFGTVTAKQVLITDSDGRARIKLTAPKLGPSGDAKIVILAENGQEIAGLGQYDGGIAVVWTQRFAGDKPSAHIASIDNSAGLSATSGGGNVPISATASKFGHSITVRDHVDAQASVVLEMRGKVPSITATNKDGREIFVAREAALLASTQQATVETKVENGAFKAKLRP